MGVTYRNKRNPDQKVSYDSPNERLEALDNWERVSGGEAKGAEPADKPAAAAQPPASAPEPPDYGSMSVKDLEQLAAARAIDVQGSGKDGRVVKADLVTALERSDQIGPGAQPARS